MLINVGAEFGKNLETSEIAIELVDILNKIPEEEFIIDFKDVMYVTMNYANESPKKISEINISDEIRVIMGAADEACNP